MPKISDEERKKLMARAEKLLRFTKENGASEGEINNAAEAIGRILRETDMSIEDIRVETIKTDIVTEESMHEFGRIQEWEWELFILFAKACSCKVYTHSQRTMKDGKKIKSRTFRLVGTESDAKVCKYFCDVMIRVLPDMAETYCDTATYFTRSGRLAVRTSYLKGLTETVAERIEKMVRPTDVSTAVTERGLSLTNNKLLAADAWMKDNLKLKNSRIKWSANKEDHYAQGKADGHNVAIHQGVNHSKPAGGYIA